MLPDLSFSDRWSRGTKLWERDWGVIYPPPPSRSPASPEKSASTQNYLHTVPGKPLLSRTVTPMLPASLCTVRSIYMTHMGKGGSGTGILGHPPARKARRRVLKSRSQNAPFPMCVSETRLTLRSQISIREKQCILKWEVTEDTTFVHGWKMGSVKYVENLAAKNIAKFTGPSSGTEVGFRDLVWVAILV